MLRVTPEQMTALSQDVGARFLDRAVRFLRERIEDCRATSVPELRRRVASYVERAASWGLGSEQAVMSYAIAAELLGPDFEVQPRVRAYLASRRRPEQKADFLDALVVAVDEMAARGSPVR